MEIAEPESDASKACSVYASCPASESVNSLIIPVPKFPIIVGISKKEQMMMIILINVKILVLGSSICFVW